MGDVSRHVRSPLGGQQLLTLDQGGPRLHQVIHNHHVPSSWGSFFQPYDSLVTITHLGANYFGVVSKLVVKSFPCTFIGVGDGDVVGIRQLAKSLSQQRNSGLKEREDLVTKVEAFLEGVDVENNNRGGASSGKGDVGDDSGQGEGCGHVTFCLHALGGARGEVG